MLSSKGNNQYVFAAEYVTGTKRCSEKFEGAPKTELTRKDETTSSE